MARGLRCYPDGTHQATTHGPGRSGTDARFRTSRTGHGSQQHSRFDEFDGDKLRAEFLGGIQSLSLKVFPYLNEKSIVIFASDRANPCWISDHPAVRYNSLNPGDGVCGTLGVANTGVEIYLPIGSQSVLGFLCTSIEEYFRKARKLFPAASAPAAVEEMLNGISAGAPIRAEPVNVMFFNSLQVAQSERYLFR